MIATVAPLARYSPNEIDRRITEPQYMSHGFAPPSAAHWFGTDELNRDMFSRLLWAGRISLAVGFLSVTIGASIGMLVGALAGYYGGWLDTVLMRITDLFLSFPFLPTLILISAMLHQYKLDGDVTLIQAGRFSSRSWPSTSSAMACVTRSTPGSATVSSALAWFRPRSCPERVARW